MIEEAAYVGIQHPVDPLRHQGCLQGIQRLMRVPPRPKTVAEPEKVDFVDGAQHPSHRPLDDLVLQVRYAERPPPTVGFRDGGAAHRLWPVSPGVDPVAKVPDVCVQVLLVVRHRHPIHTGAGCPPLTPKRSMECLVVHVMQQRREAGLARSSRRLVHLGELGWQRSPALCPVPRRPAQVPLRSRSSLRLARCLRPIISTTSRSATPSRLGQRLRSSLATGPLRRPCQRPRRGFPGSDTVPLCAKWP